MQGESGVCMIGKKMGEAQAKETRGPTGTFGILLLQPSVRIQSFLDNLSLLTDAPGFALEQRKWLEDAKTKITAQARA